MREWFDAQLAAGFPAFMGTAVSGTLAVKQELVNELLTNWLQTQTSSAGPVVDPNRLKPLVKSASVRAEPGTLLVDFHIAIE